MTQENFDLENFDLKKNNQGFAITTNTHMYVSGILHRGNDRSICVMIEDGAKSLEVRLPEGEFLSRKGYTKNEAEEILSYLNENMDDILNSAKGINPMKAFMK